MQNKLAFSTLSCPAWTFAEVLENAVRYGYDALELRGLHTHTDLSNAPEFFPQNRAESLRAITDAGLSICCVGSSCVVSKAVTDPAVGDDLLWHCELARDLNAPYVRIFGGRLAELPRPDALTRHADALRALGSIAASAGVALVLETHDDFSTGQSVAELLQAAAHKSVYALWDLHHPHRSRENGRETLQYLHNSVRHVHIKNSIRDGDKFHYTMPEEGDVPLAEMLYALIESGYTGAISVEWEKRWQPQIAEPEIALPAYAVWYRAL